MKIILLLIAVFLANSFFTAKKITWVALGDSITYLNDHPDETDFRVVKGYMTRVADQLPYIAYVNKGFNGWRATGIAKEIENMINLPKGDVYTVFLGTNDWWGGEKVGSLKDYRDNTGIGTFYGAYRIIINKIKTLNPDAKVILITPMQRGDFVYVRDNNNNAWGSYKDKNGQSLAQFADAVKAIGKYEKFEVLDLYNKKEMSVENMVKFKVLRDPEQESGYKHYTYPEYTKVPFNPAKDSYPYPTESQDVTYDGLHPSDKGNEIIANMLVTAMKKL